MQEAGARHRGGGQSPSDAPLKGKLFDDTGDHLTPTHTKRNGRIIRYYVSNRLIHGRDPTGWRLPAAEIERAVRMAVSDHLEAMMKSTAENIEEYQALSGKLAQIDDATRLGLVARVSLSASRLCVELDPEAYRNVVGSGCQELSFTSPIRLAKRGCGQKLILGEHRPAPDATLIRTLARAHDWLTRIKSGEPLSAIARSEATSESFIRTRLPLALLSPKIQAAIVTGRQRPELTTKAFAKSQVPMAWSDQEALYLS